MSDSSDQQRAPTSDSASRPTDAEPQVDLFQRLSVRAIIGLAVFFVAALAATIVAVRHGGGEELQEQGMRFNGEIGSKIVLNFAERLGAARALAMAIAELAPALPPDPELVQRALPKTLDIPGHEALIAGGGYWPEPNAFVDGVERRSFFWGRDEEGQLTYFDDYNAAAGPGYHQEEWYVPARFAQRGDVYWSRSYLDPFSFEPMVTCTAPAWMDGTLRGVSTIDLKLAGISAFMEEQASAIGGYAFAVDHNHRLISFPSPELGRQAAADGSGELTGEYQQLEALAGVHPAFAAIGERVRLLEAERLRRARAAHGARFDALSQRIDDNSYQIDAAEAERIAANLLTPVTTTPEVVQFTLAEDYFVREAAIASVFTVPGTPWRVVVVTPASVATETATAVARSITQWMAVLVFVVCIAAFLLFHSHLVRPVSQLTAELRNLTNKNVDTGHLHIDRRDELGQLAHWFNARTARLAHALEELQHKNRALEHATRAAEEANRGKNVFLASMSHEIRTPMNAIIGMTAILKDTRLSAEQVDYVSTINTSAESLLSLINDIMDYSKIEAGRLDLECIEFDVRSLLEEVSDLVSFQAEEKGLELICHFNPRANSLVRGDPGRLRQILLNLAANGIKFTASGQVAIHGDLEPIPGDEQRVRVRFEVRDSGIGISREAIARLFRPFSQGDGSTTRRFGGTGLGLAICKRLCEMMDGEIDVESMPGSGSRFRFQVTLQPSGDAQFPEFPAARHALIVDPSAAHRRVLRDVLESWSFRVVECTSANECAPLLGANPAVDLVFVGVTTDVRGAMLVRLREISRSRRLDVVIYACHVPTEVAAGAAGVLKKPLKYSQLLGLLTQLAGSGGIPTGRPAEPFTLARSPSSGGASLLRARVLIAEDNPVNQKVAQRLLARLRVPCDIVADGQQAFEAVQRIHYDVVLMDWQMPLVDGMTATRMIRGMGEQFTKLPIIAVTANAMEGDREQCLAAGMNDYLSKPITPEKLQAMLVKWLAPECEQRESP